MNTSSFGTTANPSHATEKRMFSAVQPSGDTKRVKIKATSCPVTEGHEQDDEEQIVLKSEHGVTRYEPLRRPQRDSHIHQYSAEKENAFTFWRVKEPPKIEPPKPPKIASSEAAQQTLLASKTTGLPVILQVPDGPKKYTYKCLSLLHSDVQRKLEQGFKMLCTKKGLTEEWEKAANNVQRLKTFEDGKKDCVMCWLRKVKPSYKQHGGLPRKTASDGCIRAGAPCGYLAKHDGKFHLVMVPLPHDLRRWKSWTDLRYWVKA